MFVLIFARHMKTVNLDQPIISWQNIDKPVEMEVYVFNSTIHTVFNAAWAQVSLLPLSLVSTWEFHVSQLHQGIDNSTTVSLFYLY